MNQSADCIFCMIAEGEAPCFKVYENTEVVAFMDLNPAADGHVLVIPKAHYKDVFDASSDAIHAVAEATRGIAGAIRAALKPDGLNIVQANGEAAGQTVFHYYVHLLPRVTGEKLQMHGTTRGDPGRLEELAQTLSDFLQSPA